MRTSNDNNNNQLSQSMKRDEDSGSTTIKEEMNTDDISTEDDGQEIRPSQTMITLKNCASPEMALKTSQSSPSALQTNVASKGSRSRKNANMVDKKSSDSVSNGICKCECTPKDFEKTTISPDEVKHEIVKILSDVDQITNRMSIYTDSSSISSDSPYLSYSSIRAKTLLSKYSFLYNNNHMTAAAKNQPVNIIKETMIGAQQDKDSSSSNNQDKDEQQQDEENQQQQQQEIKTVTSSSIIEATSATTATTKNQNINNNNINFNIINNKSNAKIINITSNDVENDECGNDENISLMLIDLAQSTPIITSTVPAISILPPTPDPKTQHSSHFNLTKDLEITKVNSISIKTESSFDSVEDEEEPPYVKLKTSLRRFGTMSSLERLPSEESEKTLNSSDDDSIDENKITSQFSKDLSGENSQAFRTWTSRAGSFLEESKAFIDKYLGRTDGHTSDYIYLKNDMKDATDFDEYETIEGEATSGEDVWGTPTSGGENDEMHMFNNGDGNQTVKK